MSTYVIGDLQGCFVELRLLIQKIQFRPEKDRLWFVGDLVNRGPHSLACLRFVKELGDSAITVLGNHDLSLLSLWYTRKKPSKSLKQIWQAEDAEELMNWLSGLPLVHYDEKLDCLMVHAGVPAIWSLEQTLNAGKELSDVLKGSDPLTYYQNMWGDQPAQWNDELQGMDRLRYITNALTRMRFCTVDGQLELQNKVASGKQPEDLIPWFELPSRQLKSKIVFGHWASLMGKTGSEQFIGVDTGCVWGNQLTAYCLETNRFYHHNG